MTKQISGPLVEVFCSQTDTQRGITRNEESSHYDYVHCMWLSLKLDFKLVLWSTPMLPKPQPGTSTKQNGVHRSLHVYVVRGTTLPQVAWAVLEGGGDEGGEYSLTKVVPLLKDTL